MKKCIKCSCELHENNWLTSRIIKNHYVCNNCFNYKLKLTDRYKNARTTTTKKKIFDKVLSRKISNFMKDAVVRNKTNEFSYEEIGKLMLKPCEYCGDNSKYSGIDRVDSSKGYTKDNSVPCCVKCNYGKNVYSPQEYVEHCKRVVEFKVGI